MSRLISDLYCLLSQQDGFDPSKKSESLYSKGINAEFSNVNLELKQIFQCVPIEEST